MKKLLLLSFLCTVVSVSAFSQIIYLADTAFTTDVGFGGAPASCLVPHMRYYGWQANRAQGTWLADVFTVPTGATWTFDTVIVYGAQYKSGTTSTLLNCNLQIYDGPPGLGGSVLWGDTVTNVMASTGFAGFYKVDTFSSTGGLLRTTDPMMYVKLYLSPAPQLSAGTYWLSWSIAGSGSYYPYSPTKVLPGRINPPGQMGRQLYGGAWHYISDSGKTVGFGKIIKARAGLDAVTNVTRAENPLLSQNVPNPFQNVTSIPFYMPQAGCARLSVYNAIGQLVAVSLDGNVSEGAHNALFNGDNLPGGIYYYQLNTGAGIESKKMLLVR